MFMFLPHFLHTKTTAHNKFIFWYLVLNLVTYIQALKLQTRPTSLGPVGPCHVRHSVDPSIFDWKSEMLKARWESNFPLVIYFMMDLGLTNTLKNCCKKPTIGRGELFKPHHSSQYHGTGRARDIGSQQIVDPNDAVSYTHLTLPTNREV